MAADVAVENKHLLRVLMAMADGYKHHRWVPGLKLGLNQSNLHVGIARLTGKTSSDRPNKCWQRNPSDWKTRRLRLQECSLRKQVLLGFFSPMRSLVESSPCLLLPFLDLLDDGSPSSGRIYR